MSERPGESGGMTSGDPLGGGTTDDSPPHESGLPGYTSPPPPGAGGPVAPAFGQQPTTFGGRFVLAGWWSRAGAYLIDGLIVGVGALILFLPLVAAGLTVDTEAGWATLIAAGIVWVLCLGVAALFYAPVMMARTNGKTLGRMALNIRVVRASGEPITFGYAVLREVVVKWLLFGILGALTGGIAQLLDYLWPLWDEQNRCLHDMIVDSRVVRD
jgi:uncharacterized RDD family membrane protein YckC